MLKLSRKSKAGVRVVLSLAVSAALLFALVYGYDIPRESVLGYFWQLLGVMGLFILMAAVPAMLLIWFRHKRRRSAPFYVAGKDRQP